MEEEICFYRIYAEENNEDSFNFLKEYGDCLKCSGNDSSCSWYLPFKLERAKKLEEVSDDSQKI